MTADEVPDTGDAEVPPQRTTSQISEESRAYWRPIVAAMEPMTDEDIADVAEVIRRSRARRFQEEQSS